MKKLVCALLLAAGAFCTAFSDTGDTVTFIPSLGFSSPIHNYKAEKDGNTLKWSEFDCNCIDTNGFIIFNHTGITLRYDANIGFALANKNIYGTDKSDSRGSIIGFGIGAGYAFINTNKMNLILTGTLGFEYSDYGSEEITVGSIKYKKYLTMATAEIGANLDFAYRLTDHFGLTAGVKCAIGGGTRTMKVEQSGASTTTKYADISGFTVTPRIGMCWFK